MLNRLKANLRKLINLYPAWVCRREYQRQAFTAFNERPVELAFVFRKLAELYPHTILDVGSGATALPHLMRNCGPLVTATDNVRDYWPAGMFNRHYHILDDDITATRLRQKFDLVTCISTLEHIHQPELAVRNMLRLLQPGGHLILTMPYSERSYVPNVYDLPGSSYGQGLPYITQSFSRAELDRWLADNGAEIVEQETWQCWEGEYWTVGAQIIPPRRVGVDERHQLTCLDIRLTP
jgi:2-polyprenyl-3-methyl-5-hydroxy-6-metoxy-1,4-benzoquinol methylase